MKFLGFYALWIGLLVAILRANRVLGDSIVKELDKHSSEKLGFNLIKEVNMFLEEIMYFLDQAEWITKEDIEQMLRLLERYRKRVNYEIYNKSVELDVIKETLETNEYRKIVNEFQISLVKEKEMNRQDAKNENKKLDRTEEHEIETSIDEEAAMVVDGSGLRGSSSREKAAEEPKLEKDSSSIGSTSNSGGTLTETDSNGARPKQARLQQSTGTQQYSGLSPIDEKLNKPDAGDEDRAEITQYEYQFDGSKVFDHESEQLYLLPAREVNRIMDKIDSIQLEIYNLEARLKELMRIQGVVRDLGRQIDEHLRLQQQSERNDQSEWNEHFPEFPEFPELEVEHAIISDSKN
ncbi:hypothetical protein MACJ_000448 [Theileria orientalis]|uniref:Secreted protein n=1 Tax=Theileria orientalis TaxID=68886 RepID=A0A976QRD0_THEOR|nr:hypothetical protein MACJ_000448 [Theileria orientalis]